MSMRIYRRPNSDNLWVAASYRDPQGRRKLCCIPGYANRGLTETLGRNLQRLIQCKESGAVVDPTLANWIAAMDSKLRQKLAKLGFLGAGDVAAHSPLETHLAEFEQAKRVAGKDDRYVRATVGQLRRMMGACGFAFWSDVTPAAVNAFLAEHTNAVTGDDDERAVKIRTRNSYVTAIKMFANWAVKTGRIPYTPVATLQLAKITDEATRRALTLEEARYLLAHVETAETRFKLTGAERALVYRTAIETGFRASELGSLVRGCFDLAPAAPCVHLKAASAKNAKDAGIDISRELATELTKHLANKLPTAKAFTTPGRGHWCEMFMADVREARAKWVGEAKKAKEREEREKSDFLADYNHAGDALKFHSLRHTRGTWLFEHMGVQTSREAMELMRVTRESLVRRYSRNFKVAGRAIADRAPSLAVSPATIKAS